MRDVIVVVVVVMVIGVSVTVDAISLAPVYWNHTNPM